MLLENTDDTNHRKQAHNTRDKGKSSLSFDLQNSEKTYSPPSDLKTFESSNLRPKDLLNVGPLSQCCVLPLPSCGMSRFDLTDGCHPLTSWTLVISSYKERSSENNVTGRRFRHFLRWTNRPLSGGRFYFTVEYHEEIHHACCAIRAATSTSWVMISSWLTVLRATP